MPMPCSPRNMVWASGRCCRSPACSRRPSASCSVFHAPLHNKRPHGRKASPHGRDVRARGGSPRAVMTEADGRFVFEGVEPGSYQLAAERTGYLRATYSASKSSRSSGVSVASGQSVTGLELKMMPHGVLVSQM